MKVGAMSDTHGDLTAIDRAVHKIGDVELWLHAGDFSQDGSYLARKAGRPVLVVAGNCDRRTTAKPDEFIEIGGIKIWLTHGHRYRVRNDLDELIWWGNRFGVQIIVYGHSHVPDITWQDNFLIFNPGSTVYPRKGHAPSCGLLTIGGNSQVEAQIIYF